MPSSTIRETPSQVFLRFSLKLTVTYALPRKPMTYDISQVRITPVQPMNGLLAFASVVLNGNIRLNSIAIHRKLDGSGLRLTYPTKRAGNEDRMIFHPITPDLSKAIEQVLFEEYRKLHG